MNNQHPIERAVYTMFWLAVLLLSAFWLVMVDP
jgi:hypothetical protein